MEYKAIAQGTTGYLPSNRYHIQKCQFIRFIGNIQELWAVGFYPFFKQNYNETQLSVYMTIYDVEGTIKILTIKTIIPEEKPKCSVTPFAR